SIAGPAGLFKILVKPDGTKFYLVGTNSIQAADASFTSGSFHTINGILAPTAAALTPDGKYLLVGADKLYIIDTSNDSIVGSPALASIPVIGIAVSQDSTKAFVLTKGVPERVTAINVTTRQVTGTPLAFQFSGATSITISPIGFLY